MPVNFKTKPIIDALPGGAHEWATGTGSIGIWVRYGDVAESQRLYDDDPWGDQSIVWQTNPDAVAGADGGWITSYFSLDQTKLYRFSVWGRKTSVTNSGRMYFGTDATAGVIQLADGVVETNPYWGYPLLSQMTQNLWYLMVGHVFPVDYRAESDGFQVDTHPNTGMWTIAGGKAPHIPLGGNIGGDCKFNSTTTSLNHRTFCNGSTSTAAHLQFYDPRVELCDGSEGTVVSLLLGPTTYSGNTLATTSITREGGSFKHQKVNATGGDRIGEVGEWRYHMFTGDGSFDVISYVGSALEVEYLVVGGGGGGGMNMGGGGGGGGVLADECYLTGTTYTITVGAGGAGAPDGTGGHSTVVGTNGGNSTFNGLTAYGGGYGGISPNSIGYAEGNNGGCGGGASGYNGGVPYPVIATGVAGQGFNGGGQGSAYYSGGGGGAGAVGASGNSPATGGAGKFSDILGRPYYWGGGGGGAGYSIAGADGGIGGGGGGAVGNPTGNGGRKAITWGHIGTQGALVTQANVPGGDGGAFSGGGGGGGAHYQYTNHGGDGGSGIVVVRYKYK